MGSPHGRYVINDTQTLETMQVICSDSGSELDTSAGATVTLTFPDGTVLSHEVTFAE